MNPIAREIASYFGSAQMSDEEFFEHYGTPQRFAGDPTGSGRYREGSGKNPFQHTDDFLSRVEQLKAQGWTETPENIMKEFGLTTTKYRIEKSICLDERKASDISRAKALKADGRSNTEIGKIMGVNESTVRGWFEQEQKSRYTKSKETAEFLKKQVDEKGMIDVGKDVELDQSLNISREKLDTALYLLEREGYHIYGGRVPQPTNPSKQTTLKVLARPDIEHKEIFEYDKIQTISDYISRDNGKTFEKKFTYPASMDSKRIKVLLKDEIGPDGLTGEQQDGLIQIRRGVPDLDLGNSRYAQVRILVDKNKYIKGMAVYSDNIPDGYDLIFNSNKKNVQDAFKDIKKDPDNPFGSNLKENGGQYWYIDKNGKKKLGLINKTREEADWTQWKDALPSQFLSKQSLSMAKKQLNLAKAERDDEFNEIMSLNNPTLKKYYLQKFSEKCDSAAVELKAAALPGQKYHVIIPINTLKDTEVYAPQYKEGTKLALIRYPHAGTFEIPILTVNNKNVQAKKVIGNSSIDAIGITKNVADRLSGADFDGDTVMCIPTHDSRNKIKVTNTKAIKDLEHFNPTDAYQADNIVTDKKGNKHYYRAGKEFYPINDRRKQNEMGQISNLITDMTLAGATESELVRAVKHSMVTIDAEKHKLDIKASAIDNNIDALKKKYQPKYDKNGNLIGYGGAATIISKAKGDNPIPKRKGQPNINTKDKKWYDPTKPEGALIYKNADPEQLYYAAVGVEKATGKKYLTTTDGKKVYYDKNPKGGLAKNAPVLKIDADGGVYFTDKGTGTLRYKYRTRTDVSTKMAETDDAFTLVSKKKHPMEILYAEYANNMKALANKARIEITKAGKINYDPNAKKIYSKEVESLETKLKEAKQNTVKERAATRYAAQDIKRLREEYPDLKTEDVKKMSQRYMTKYRDQFSSVKRSDRNIKISDREWEAIQAGAISENKLMEILKNSDPDLLRERAMPKKTNTLSASQIARIKAMSMSNFTLNQIASKLNVSTATVSKYLKGAD